MTRRSDETASDKAGSVTSGGSSQAYLFGVAWAGLSAASNVLLPFAVFVFFAREMSPPMLGLVALASACAELLKAVGLPGVYEALLQQKEDLRRCYETALALLLAAGLILAPACLLLLYGLGFVVPGLHAHFPLLAWLALRIPLDLAAVQPQAILVKRLDYRRLSLRSVLANLVAGAGGALTAWLASPVVGLLVYQVGQSILSFAGVAVGRGLLARPRLHHDCVARLRQETIFSTGNRVLAATINYVDQMMIGPLASETGLAFYNLGKRLETTFVTVANSFSSVLFQPLFAADGALCRQRATRRALLVLTLVCGTPAAVVFCNSRLVVGLIFGPHWVGAAPIVGWLCLNGLIRAIGMVPGSLLSVSGRNRELLMTSIVSAVGSLLLVAALAGTSVTVCAAGLAVKNALVVVWLGWLTRRDVPQPALTYGTSVIAPAGLMIVTAALVARHASSSTGLPPAGWHSDCLGLAASIVAVSVLGGVWVVGSCGLKPRWPWRPPVRDRHA